MANFPKLFPSGVSLNAAYPSDKLEDHDIAQSKSVNGDEGSDHEGYVTLGGLRVASLRRRIKTTSVTGAAIATVTVDASLGSVNSHAQLITTSSAGYKTLVFDFENVTEGSEYMILLKQTESPAVGAIVSWTGSGITHRHATGDSQPRVKANNYTIWRGIAVSATEIWWTQNSL